jgi:hypothetical protein
MAVVEYMRVKPGNFDKYLEVEKTWKKIHEERLKGRPYHKLGPLPTHFFRG